MLFSKSTEQDQIIKWKGLLSKVSLFVGPFSQFLWSIKDPMKWKMWPFQLVTCMSLWISQGQTTIHICNCIWNNISIFQYFKNHFSWINVCILMTKMSTWPWTPSSNDIWKYIQICLYVMCINVCLKEYLIVFSNTCISIYCIWTYSTTSLQFYNNVQGDHSNSNEATT